MNFCFDYQYIDVDILYFYYDKALASRPVEVRLAEINSEDLQSLKLKGLHRRFGSCISQKLQCGRFCWYVHRMKLFLSARPKHKLRIKHWSIRSGNLDTFKFCGEIYPDVAYTFDSKGEHWFLAKVDLKDNHLIMDHKSRDIVNPAPVKDILEKFRQQTLRSNYCYTFMDFSEDLEKAYLEATSKNMDNLNHKFFFQVKRKKAQSLFKSLYDNYDKLGFGNFTISRT